MQSTILNLWLAKIDPKLKDELILPAFLQETGKFLISDAIKEQKKELEFLKAIQENFLDIASVEKEFIGMTSSEITSAVFKHWNLTPSIVNSIKYADNPQKAPPMVAKYSQILHIVKVTGNIVKPLDPKCIDFASTKIQEFNLELKPFQAGIEKLEDRLLDAK